MQQCGRVLLVYLITQTFHVYDAIRTALEDKLSDKLSGDFGVGEGYIQASQFVSDDVATGLTTRIFNEASASCSYWRN